MVIDPLHRGAKVPDHTVMGQGLAQFLAQADGQQRRDRAGRRVQQRHLKARADQIVGKFAASQPGAMMTMRFLMALSPSEAALFTRVRRV